MKAAKKSNRGYTFSEPHIDPLGDSALIVGYEQRIDPGVNVKISLLQNQIVASNTRGITSVVPSYAALTVHYDARFWSFADLRAHLLSLQEPGKTVTPPAARTIEIPVRYGGAHGPDLEDMARQLSLPVEEIIRRHARSTYQVYFIGFQPGFPYMGGLDVSLALPRRQTPRVLVPAGSVGIAGNQTGIYPQDSPGGWHIIGWTPVKLFDPYRDPPSLLATGDVVRFLRINSNEPDHA